MGRAIKSPAANGGEAREGAFICRASKRSNRLPSGEGVRPIIVSIWVSHRVAGKSQGRDDGFASRLLGGRYFAQDSVESSQAERLVVGDRNPVVTGRIGLQNDVAADLVNLGVAPIATEHRHKVAAVNVAGELHAITSSRTR